MKNLKVALMMFLVNVYTMSPMSHAEHVVSVSKSDDKVTAAYIEPVTIKADYTSF